MSSAIGVSPLGGRYCVLFPAVAGLMSLVGGGPRGYCALEDWSGRVDIPRIWTELGEQVHQDFVHEQEDLLVGFREIFDAFSASQRSELRDFLGSARVREMPAAQLAELWSRSGADLVIVDVGDTPLFYRMLLEELEASMEAHRPGS